MIESLDNIDEKDQEGSVNHFSNTNDESSSAFTASLDLSSKEVFSAVFDQLSPWAFFLSNKILKNSEDAADIVSNVFAKLWARKMTFKTIWYAKAYLRRSLKNACIDHCRNKSHRIRKEIGSQYILHENADQNKFLYEDIHAELLELIYAEIEKLPKTCKKIFKLAYIDGLKSQQIADMLGISVFTVKNQKSLALRILKTSLLTALVFYYYTKFSTWN